MTAKRPFAKPRKMDQGELDFISKIVIAGPLGRLLWLLWNATPNKSLKLTFAVARDITQRKQTERRLATGYAVTNLLADAESGTDPQILKAICEGLGWELGDLWRMLDDSGGALHCLDIWHLPRLQFPSVCECHATNDVQTGRRLARSSLGLGATCMDSRRAE